MPTILKIFIKCNGKISVFIWHCRDPYIKNNQESKHAFRTKWYLKNLPHWPQQTHCNWLWSWPASHPVQANVFLIHLQLICIVFIFNFYFPTELLAFSFSLALSCKLQLFCQLINIVFRDLFTVIFSW